MQVPSSSRLETPRIQTDRRGKEIIRIDADATNRILNVTNRIIEKAELVLQNRMVIAKQSKQFMSYWLLLDNVLVG